MHANASARQVETPTDPTMQRTRAAGIAIAAATVISTIFVAMDRSGGGTNPLEILQGIAQKTELSRKQVASVFEALSDQIKNNVGKKGPGIFVVPGLMKITVIQKPATKARMGINPFTKQEQMFKAKPARKVIKVRPLKALKDMAK